MKVLFVSDFYPPLELGGWEQLTQEISLRLAARGHIRIILTSRHRAGEAPKPEPYVYRVLNLESYDIRQYHLGSWFRRRRRERENGEQLRAVVARCRPDVIFFHSMWNMPRSVAWYAEQLMPGRVVYFIAGDWPYVPNVHETYWRMPANRWWRRLPKRAAAVIPLLLLQRQRRLQPLRFEHVLCVSNAVRQDLAQNAEIPPSRSRVIYNGIDTEQFSPDPDWRPREWRGSAPSLLYAGSLMRSKGVHAAVEGFAQALGLPALDGATLTIVGGGHPAYRAELELLVSKAGMSSRVCFLDRIDRSDMPALLRRHDILIFPSRWEALARMMQEAMACGLVVVGTTTGGSKELLVEGETGLTFEVGDTGGLAKQIQRLVVDPDLRARLAQAGRQEVVKRFGIGRMVDEMEAYLAKVVAGDSSAT
jgi:glycosyltransferase involved in cell wall biosynthesis